MSAGLSPSRPLLPRLLGALTLREETYAEIAADSRAGLQAGIIVVLSGILEASVDASIHGYPNADVSFVLLWVFDAILVWLLWSGLLWLVAVRFFTYPGDFAPVTRAVAFAHVAIVWYAVAAVPPVAYWAGFVFALSLAWFGAALVTATRAMYRVPGSRAALIVAATFACRWFVSEVVPYAVRLVPSGS